MIENLTRLQDYLFPWRPGMLVHVNEEIHLWALPRSSFNSASHLIRIGYFYPKSVALAFQEIWDVSGLNYQLGRVHRLTRSLVSCCTRMVVIPGGPRDV